MKVDESNPWRVHSTAVKFDSRFFLARQDMVSIGDGAPNPYSSIRTKYQGVCVAPIDPDGHVTLVGQYRYVLDRYTWELPGGGAARGANDLDVAKAELREETGQQADHWLKIISGGVSVGLSDEVVSGYVAWSIRQGKPNPDPEEHLSFRRIPFDEAIDMVLRGEIAHLVGSAILLGIQARLHRGDLPESLASLIRRDGPAKTR